MIRVFLVLCCICRVSTGGVIISPVQMVIAMVFSVNTSFNFLIVCRQGISSRFPLLMLKNVNCFSFTTSNKDLNEFSKFSGVIGIFRSSLMGMDTMYFPKYLDSILLFSTLDFHNAAVSLLPLFIRLLYLSECPVYRRILLYDHSLL